MEALLSGFAGLDTRLVFGVAIILAILAVISLAKKAIKLAVFIIIITVITSYGGIAIDKLQSDYNLKLDASGVSMTINGNDYDIDFSSITQLDAFDMGNGKTKITITKTDGKVFVEVPHFIYQPIRTKAIQLGITVNEL